MFFLIGIVSALMSLEIASKILRNNNLSSILQLPQSVLFCTFFYMGNQYSFYLFPPPGSSTCAC